MGQGADTHTKDRLLLCAMRLSAAITTDLFLLDSPVAEFKDQTLTSAVTLDGNVFINIDFTDAELTYSGGVPPGFDNCRFNNATFSIDGAAGNTLAFLRSMAPASTNMRFVVQGLIPELQG